jgi:hypothetical protein
LLACQRRFGQPIDLSQTASNSTIKAAVRIGISSAQHSVQIMWNASWAARLYFGHKQSAIFTSNTSVMHRGLRVAKLVWGGNCSGMAASSALFFANWATPATFLDDHAADKPFDLVVGDLVAGLWPENGISDFVVRYQGYQTGQQVRRAKIDAAGRSVAQDLAIIKAAIDGGLQAPIYVSIQSRTGQPDCVGHALIPYAYRDTGAVTLIYVYDPNHPGDEDAVLVLSPNLNAWRYDHRNSIGVWDSVDNTCGGDPLRAIPIEAWKDMPLPPWNGEDSRTQTGELTTNLVEVNASGGASLLILDVQG